MPAPRHRHAAMLGLAALLLAAPTGASAAVPPPPGFADLVARVEPAVVRIETLENAAARRPGRAGIATGRGAQQQRSFSQGAGSGFIIDADGTIVTNHHVAGEAQRITVTLADGTELPAQVVGSDPVTDIAVLKVTPPAGRGPLPTLRFAEGPPPRVGDWALVMGNPFGIGASVSLGVVSARGREIGGPIWGDLIQTDAAINPGNSGGPLFNLEGRVAGVTTAIVSPTGTNVGVGFAVPAAVAARVVQALRTEGRFARSFLGVDAQPMTTALSRGLGGAPPRGALIDRVIPGTPADAAGLQAGDVVTALDEAPMDSPAALARAVALVAPGNTAELAFWRAGREMTASLRLVAAPAPAQRAATPPPPPAPDRRGYGLQFNAPPGGRAAGRGEARAVVGRVAPGGAAAEAGLRQGDVVISVGGAAVRGPEEAVAALEAAAARAASEGQGREDYVILRVLRGEAAVFVALATPR